MTTERYYVDDAGSEIEIPEFTDAQVYQTIVDCYDSGSFDSAYDVLEACPELLAEIERDDITYCDMVDRLRAGLED